jgi:chromosome segregation ATPase
MYDLYLNNKLLLGFNEIAYKSGGIGFIIGPAAIGKVDFINIYTSKNELVSEPPANGVGSAGETDIIALAESIIELKSQLNKIQRENEDLKERIDAFMGSEKEQLKLKADFEQRLSVSDRIIKSKDKTIDSLLMVNQDLQRYKELVKGNDGGDLVITLSKNLKSEKLKADELSKQNQALKDSIASLELQIKNQSGKSNNSSGSKANSAKPENTFVLPKEN